jgi:hypothetical protein
MKRRMNELVVMVGLSAAFACQRSRAPDLRSMEPAPVASSGALSAAAASVQSVPGAGPLAKPNGPLRSFSFDTDPSGSPPSGLSFARTGSGPPGRWLVRADQTAPSAPNVLAQLDDDSTSFRFPVAVTSEVQPRDVRVSVRCKMISGRVDQACGLVLRYRDEKNYLITRANALEGNIRLYTVRDGDRDQIASHSEKLSANAWHAYAFEAKAQKLRVLWNGKPVLEHVDDTLMEPGRVGVWTKADSVTYFDDLKIEPL